MNLQDDLKVLHAAYCRLTGIPLRFGYQFEQQWFMWRREGYTEADLEMTINYLKTSQRNRPELLTPNLRLHKLIGDLGFFEERRAEAEKCRTIKQNAAKAGVLRATGRESQEPATLTRSLRDVITSEAFKAFVEMKGKL
jgi:hypothetical protein